MAVTVGTWGHIVTCHQLLLPDNLRPDGDDPDDNDDDDDRVLRSEDQDTDMARNAPVSSFCLSLVSIKQTGCTTQYPTRITSEDIFF